MIRVHDICKGYGTTAVLDGVSLSLPKGGLTSIIGPNGAGKSTLLSVLSRLTRPDHGQVLIDGLDVHRCPPPLWPPNCRFCARTTVSRHALPSTNW